MISEAASTGGNQGGQLNAGGAQPRSPAPQERNRAPHAQGRPPLNKNARREMNNHVHPGSCQRGNAKKIEANKGMTDRVNQIATTITQMVAVLNKINGIPTPSTMRQLGEKIPQFEISCQNEPSTRSGQN